MSRSGYQDLAKNVKKYRRRADLSQEMLTKKASMVPKSIVGIEAGN